MAMVEQPKAERVGDVGPVQQKKLDLAKIPSKWLKRDQTQIYYKLNSALPYEHLGIWSKS